MTPLPFDREALAFAELAAGARGVCDVCPAAALFGVGAMERVARSGPEPIRLFGGADSGARHQLRSCGQRARLPAVWLRCWCLHCTRRKRGLTAVLIALSLGLLLAAFIEAAQSFLQTRIPSNLDLLTNTAGATLGALIAAPFASNLIDRGRLGRLAAALVRARRIAVAAADRGLARSADLSGAHVVRQRQYQRRARRVGDRDWARCCRSTTPCLP